MAKKKINLTVFILSGVLWTALYSFIILPLIGCVLNFNFLSPGSWMGKYHDFINYKWRVNSLSDTILLFMMIFWIPFFFWGWRFFYRLNWKKLKPNIHFNKASKKPFEIKDAKPIYHMPRKMPSTIQTSRYVAPKLPNQKEEIVSGQKSHTNLAQMIRQAAALARKYKVEIFQHILLEGFRVPMAVSTDARAVLIEIVNRKKVNWSVEFTDDVTAGGWYSEGGIMERMAQDLMGASKSLAKSEPNSEVLSAILVTDGRVLNAKQAVEYFRSKGIFLLGFNNAEPKSELPDLASFFSAYFDLKDGETDPAPHPVEKVPVKSKQAVSQIPEPELNNVPEEETAEETREEPEETAKEETPESALTEEETSSSTNETESSSAAETVMEQQAAEADNNKSTGQPVKGMRAPDMPLPKRTEE